METFIRELSDRFNERLLERERKGRPEAESVEADESGEG